MEQQQQGIEKWMSYLEFLQNELTKCMLQMAETTESSISYHLLYSRYLLLEKEIEDYKRVYKV